MSESSLNRISESRGDAFHRHFIEEYDLTAAGIDDIELLGEVCRTLDELDAIHAAVRDQGMQVVGSRQQPRANPLLDEARKHRATLATLLKQLIADEKSDNRTPSQKAAHAARTRWAKQRVGA